jgi:hypothetical protein
VCFEEAPNTGPIGFYTFLTSVTPPPLISLAYAVDPVPRCYWRVNKILDISKSLGINENVLHGNILFILSEGRQSEHSLIVCKTRLFDDFPVLSLRYDDRYSSDSMLEVDVISSYYGITLLAKCRVKDPRRVAGALYSGSYGMLTVLSAKPQKLRLGSTKNVS